MCMILYDESVCMNECNVLYLNSYWSIIDFGMMFAGPCVEVALADFL